MKFAYRNLDKTDPFFPSHFSSSFAIAGEHRQDREHGSDQGRSAAFQQPENKHAAGSSERFDAVRQRTVVQRVAEQDRPSTRSLAGHAEREEPSQQAGNATGSKEKGSGAESDESIRSGQQQAVFAEL